MKVCEHKECTEQIEDKYRFCYEHRKDKYYDQCHIHGKQLFSEGKCLKCQEMKKPIYRIYNRNGKYYFNRDKKPLPLNSFLKPYYKVLTHKTKAYQKQFMCNISNQPGIYGIFVRDRRKKSHLGECLYVGQSQSISKRIEQHKKNFVVASNHIKGLKAHNKTGIIVIPKYKVESKYYMMAKDYWLKDLKFVCLYKIPKKKFLKLSQEEQKMLLTFLEQCEMDVWQPKLNYFAARPNT